MTQYKTEKRKAAVGERILITSARNSFGKYENGAVFTVTQHGNVYADLVFVKEVGVAIEDREYEVIIAETPAQPDHPSLKAQATAAISALIAQAYAEGYEAGRQLTAKEAFEEYRAERAEELKQADTPQQQRDRIVEQAKADVEDRYRPHWGIPEIQVVTSGCGSFLFRPEFHVNKDKRAVTALLKHPKDNLVMAKGIAKCAPDDCFNTALGKAISLRRALGLEVPAEYLNAPAPTEVRVGDVAEGRVSGRRINIREVGSGGLIIGNYENGKKAATVGYTIIDDSHENTEGVSE